MSSDTEIRDERKPRSSSTTYLAAVIALPFLYVLSVGPAIFLSKRFPALFWLIITVYYPLEMAMRTGCGNMLKSYLRDYIDWWRSI